MAIFVEAVELKLTVYLERDSETKQATARAAVVRRAMDAAVAALENVDIAAEHNVNSYYLETSQDGDPDAHQSIL